MKLDFLITRWKFLIRCWDITHPEKPRLASNVLVISSPGSDSNKINVIRTPGDETKGFCQVFKLRRIQFIVFRHGKSIIINKLSKRKMFFIAIVTWTTIHTSAKYWFLKLKTKSLLPWSVLLLDISQLIPNLKATTDYERRMKLKKMETQFYISVII